MAIPGTSASAGSGQRNRRGPRVLILVENLSVPFDRRVWQESRALSEAGYRVEVICPRGTKHDTEPFAEIDNVRIHRYPLNAATGGPAGYLREYGTALCRTLRIAWRLSRDEPFDVVHACNPPDLLFLIALALRPTGARFLFDHHDLVPELFESRFAGGPRVLRAVSRLLERLTSGPRMRSSARTKVTEGLRSGVGGCHPTACGLCAALPTCRGSSRSSATPPSTAASGSSLAISA